MLLTPVRESAFLNASTAKPCAGAHVIIIDVGCWPTQIRHIPASWSLEKVNRDLVEMFPAFTAFFSVPLQYVRFLTILILIHI